jgi:hypothetical protein
MSDGNTLDDPVAKHASRIPSTLHDALKPATTRILRLHLPSTRPPCLPLAVGPILPRRRVNLHLGRLPLHKTPFSPSITQSRHRRQTTIDCTVTMVQVRTPPFVYTIFPMGQCVCGDGADDVIA